MATKKKILKKATVKTKAKLKIKDEPRKVEKLKIKTVRKTAVDNPGQTAVAKAKPKTDKTYQSLLDIHEAFKKLPDFPDGKYSMMLSLDEMASLVWALAGSHQHNKSCNGFDLSEVHTRLGERFKMYTTEVFRQV